MRVWLPMLLAVLLAACTPAQDVSAPAEVDLPLVVAQAGGAGFICGENEDGKKMGCSCLEGNADIYNCKGMDKLCKRMGGTQPKCGPIFPDKPNDSWCACAFYLR